MGLPDGQCFMCKKPIFVETGNLRPLCVDCEKKANERIAKMMKRRGKNVNGKCLVFPKKKDPDNAA